MERLWNPAVVLSPRFPLETHILPGILQSSPSLHNRSSWTLAAAAVSTPSTGPKVSWSRYYATKMAFPLFITGTHLASFAPRVFCMFESHACTLLWQLEAQMKEQEKVKARKKTMQARKETVSKYLEVNSSSNVLVRRDLT